MVDGALRYTSEGGDIAIIKDGDIYRIYDYATGTVSNPLTRGEANAALRKYQGDIVKAAGTHPQANGGATDSANTSNAANRSDAQISNDAVKETARAREAKGIDALLRKEVKDYAGLSDGNKGMIRKLVRDARKHGIPEADILTYARVSAHSGVKIVFDKAACYNPKTGKYTPGHYDLDTDRIVVNPDKALSTDKLLSHEGFHDMVAHLGGGKQYKNLLKIVKKAMSESERGDIKTKYAVLFGETRPEVIDEEYIGNYAELTTSKGFMEFLVSEKPSIKEKILSFFKRASVAYKSDERLSRSARKFYNAYKKMFDIFSEQNRHNAASETVTSINSEKMQVTDGERRWAYIGDTKDDRRCYVSDFDSSVSMDERIKLFKERIATIFNLGAVELKTDVKKIQIKGDKFTAQKNIYGDFYNENGEQDAKISALYDLADILATAEYDANETEPEPSFVNPNDKPKNAAHKGVKYWYKFRNEIVFDGVPFTVTFNIRDKGKEQFEYLIEFKENKTPGLSNTAVKNLLRTDQVSYSNSIHQKEPIVNTSDQKNQRNALPELDAEYRTNEVLSVLTLKQATALSSRNIKGDELLNAVDLASDILSVNGQITDDAKAVLYHGTTHENAKKIVESGKMYGKEDALFFSTKKDGIVLDYGEDVIEVQIPLEKLKLNDVFDSEVHLTMSVKPYTPTNIRFALPEESDFNTEFQSEFEKNVDAILNGTYQSDNIVLIGRTPEALTKIGLNQLPLTITANHIYSIAKTEVEAKAEGRYSSNMNYHGLGEAAVKKIREKLGDPVMILAHQEFTQAQKDHHAQSNKIIVAVELQIDGKQVICPIQVDAEIKRGTERYDLNLISTYFDKKNFNELIKEAIAKESIGEVGFYYLNSKKANALLQGSGYQLPQELASRLSASGTIIRHISENVNRKISHFTESQQFKRFFGDWQNKPKSASKIVNADGTPKIVYHGTNVDFSEFDTSKIGSSTDDGIYGEGFYFSSYRGQAEQYGKVGEYYLDVRKPLVLSDYDSIEKLANRLNMSESNFSISNGIIRPRYAFISQFTSHVKAAGFDGVIVDNGTSDEIVVFEPTKIKSATENIGTYDSNNPNKRYAVPEGIDTDKVEPVGKDGKFGPFEAPFTGTISSVTTEKKDVYRRSVREAATDMALATQVAFTNEQAGMKNVYVSLC